MIEAMQCISWQQWILPTSVGFFYPRLVPIHTVDADGDDIPAPIRCTVEKITDDGAYILGEIKFKFFSQ